MIKKVAGIVLLIFTVTLLSIFFAGCSTAKQKKPLGTKKFVQEPVIRLYVNETGQIKKLKMEDYVAGVVAAEMDPKWSTNALAAQSILVRTFTLKQMKDKGGVPQHKADASTSVKEFQAYDPTRINDNVKKAVKMTRGKVIKYKGQYINSWFSACDGGIEASAIEGLAYNKEKTPYIKDGAKDDCLKITVPENVKWTAKFPAQEFSNAAQKVMGQDPGSLSSGAVTIAKKGPTGRAQTIKVGKVNVGAAALRLALGNEKMRSIFLDNIYLSNGEVILTGKGYGHGVGMCQWGAKKMAAEGKKPEDIINFYFKGVTIDTLWK